MIPPLNRSRSHRVLAGLGAAIAVSALAVAPSATSATPPGAAQLRPACAAVSGRFAHCLAEYAVAPRGRAAATAAHPVTPADIQAAYHLPSGAGSGMIVGIVDAHDDPRAEADLAKFRARYHLPPCTSANGCFRKVSQVGRTSPLPSPDPGWGLEISLDLDAVSAACPQCHILLVEGRSASLRNLGIAVNTAVRLGADVVSNSYGLDEFGGMRGIGGRYYRHPGVPILASTGDYGFGPASFPAVLGTVIAVGGTTLNRAAGTARGWTEKVWDGAGSGCSAYIPKPAWQRDGHCLMRTVGDVAAVADPNTGLLVNDSFGFKGIVRVGGTSLSSPLVAAMIAMAGNTTTISNASGLYAHAAGLNDVVGGSNGFCGGDYLCTGRPGYDAPTGVGTPNGLGAL